MRIILLLFSLFLVSCGGNKVLTSPLGKATPAPKSLKGYLQSDNPDDRLNGARYYYDKGDYKKAISLYEILINGHHSPYDDEYYFNYANSHYAIGEFETAASLFILFYLTYPENINAETTYFYAAKCYYDAAQQNLQLSHHYLIKAKQGFQAYLQAYPNGEYNPGVQAYLFISDKLLSSEKISRKTWKLAEAETLSKIPSITK